MKTIHEDLIRNKKSSSVRRRRGGGFVYIHYTANMLLHHIPDYHIPLLKHTFIMVQSLLFTCLFILHTCTHIKMRYQYPSQHISRECYKGGYVVAVFIDSESLVDLHQMCQCDTLV